LIDYLLIKEVKLVDSKPGGLPVSYPVYMVFYDAEINGEYISGSECMQLDSRGGIYEELKLVLNLRHNSPFKRDEKLNPDCENQESGISMEIKEIEDLIKNINLDIENLKQIQNFYLYIEEDRDQDIFGFGIDSHIIELDLDFVLDMLTKQEDRIFGSISNKLTRLQEVISDLRI